MKIHIRETDDWVAIYKDDKRVWGTHSCSITDGLEALGIPFTQEWKDPAWDGDPMFDFFTEVLNERENRNGSQRQ